MNSTIQFYIALVIFYLPIIFLFQFILWSWVKPRKSYPNSKFFILLAIMMFIVLINNVIDRMWKIRLLPSDSAPWNSINYWIFFSCFILMLISFYIMYLDTQKEIKRISILSQISLQPPIKLNMWDIPDNDNQRERKLEKYNLETKENERKERALKILEDNMSDYSLQHIEKVHYLKKYLVDAMIEFHENEIRHLRE